MRLEEYKTDLSKHVSIHTQINHKGFKVIKIYYFIINVQSEARMEFSVVA